MKEEIDNAVDRRLNPCREMGVQKIDADVTAHLGDICYAQYEMRPGDHIGKLVGPEGRKVEQKTGENLVTHYQKEWDNKGRCDPPDHIGESVNETD